MSPFLYQTLLFVVRPLVKLRLRLRARREPEYGKRVSERFGQVPDSVREGGVWVHTVSAGETIAATPFIQGLLEDFPDTPFLITTMTPTGSAQVTDRLGDTIDHCYAPYDFKDGVVQFFDRVKPRVLVLMETELWPNMIRVAAERGVPVYLVNARLSERSAKGYLRLGRLGAEMFARLTHVACQTRDHRDRFVALGVDPQNLTVTGSVKYDIELPEDFDTQVSLLRARFNLRDQPVWIAASTHPGEDQSVIDAHMNIRARLPDARLVLVPRHPVRCDEVAKQIATAGLSVARHSETTPEDAAADVILGDEMGTLQTLYGLAQAAYVGGSLVDKGGHNPIEPALCALPVVCGPFQYNFADVMANMQRAGGLCTVTSAEDLAQVMGDWLENDTGRVQAGQAALAAVEGNRGAQARIEALVGAWIAAALTQAE